MQWSLFVTQMVNALDRLVCNWGTQTRCSEWRALGGPQTTHFKNSPLSLFSWGCLYGSHVWVASQLITQCTKQPEPASRMSDPNVHITARPRGLFFLPCKGRVTGAGRRDYAGKPDSHWLKRATSFKCTPACSPTRRRFCGPCKSFAGEIPQCR